MAGSSRLSGPKRGYYDRRGRKLRALSEDHQFSFACDQCGRCCHGADISLNPYDILKISDYYGITTREFLEDFTRWAVASESGIPIVFLKAEPSCPFNREGLCNVYQIRPFLCRSYPVIRIVTYNPSEDEVNVKYSLGKNCSTIKTKKTQTIREWLTSQCGDVYLQESLRWSEFKVRLAASMYPKGDPVFHRLFYNIVYALELPEDEIKVLEISEVSSPEERFRAMLKFVSELDWEDFVEKAKADGVLIRMEHRAGLAGPSKSSLPLH